MPRHNAKQSREDRFKKFILGGNQRKGNVFNLSLGSQNLGKLFKNTKLTKGLDDHMNQAARLQEQVNKELGGK